MSVDNVFVSLIVRELRERLLNGNINSVRQIDRDAYLLSVHVPGDNCNLLFNCAPASARVCISKNSYSFTDKPSNFLLVLKKHITGKRISAVEQINNDRIIKLTLSGCNQFGDESAVFLYSELTGNNTNLILCLSDGIIIDCLKKREYNDITGRAVIPGLLYRLPPASDGIVLPGADKKTIDDFAASSESYQKFIAGINGISAKVKSSLTNYTQFQDFLSTIHSGKSDYFCYDSGRNFSVISYIPLNDYSDSDCNRFETASEVLDYCYRRVDFQQKNSQVTKKLNSLVSVLLKRKRKKLINLQSDLGDCAKKDGILKDAELLKANLYAAKKGDRYVKCIDYYSDNLDERIIEIDPFKEPAIYLASLYKQYSKYKNAETVLSSEINKCSYEVEYLESVLEEINRVSDDVGAAEIENELEAAGYIKKKDSRKKNTRSTFLTVKAPSGKEILIGRNNSQNDELTFKKAFRDDMWFHVKNQHGSHVVLRSSGNGFSEQDIIAACEYAAFYSQARNSGKTAVDYTLAANVRRNSPYYPGRVLYTDYKTAVVSSDGTEKNNKSG